MSNFSLGLGLFLAALTAAVGLCVLPVGKRRGGATVLTGFVILVVGALNFQAHRLWKRSCESQTVRVLKTGERGRGAILPGLAPCVLVSHRALAIGAEIPVLLDRSADEVVAYDLHDYEEDETRLLKFLSLGVAVAVAGIWFQRRALNERLSRRNRRNLKNLHG